jgi:hypothetical protein
MAVIIAVLFAAVFLGAAAAGWCRYVKRRLRAPFGPKLKTVASEHEGVRKVDREFYNNSWEHLQGEFVDGPSLSLAGFRAAQQTSRRVTQDSAATPANELRRAMQSYHALFAELLGDPDAAMPVAAGGSATALEHHGQEANV